MMSPVGPTTVEKIKLNPPDDPRHVEVARVRANEVRLRA
jgi:hypothetical protein